ncbi:MAG: hypothetical protein AAGI91_08110 [Bacteroidota bacterium]
MPSKQSSILVGALTVGVLSTSYLGLINALCCLGVMIGAAVAVWHYTDTHALTIAGGTGAGIGAAAGALGSIVSALLTLLLLALGLDGGAIEDLVMDRFRGMMTEEQIRDIEAQQEASRTVTGWLSGTLLGALLFAVFGAIGGAVGAALFKKGGPEPEF